MSLKYILPLIFIGSSLAGLAYMLWEGKAITQTRLVAACILNGFAGLITALLLHEQMRNSPAMLAAISLLAGIGGVSTIDLLMAKYFQHKEKKNGNSDEPPDTESPKS